MNITAFIALANALGRPDFIGPLAIGRVATDLFAFALGLKCPSSLFKKLENAVPGQYPPLHESPDSRRKWFLLAEIESWHATSLRPVEKNWQGCSDLSTTGIQLVKKRRGRPPIGERREAQRQGVSVTELRRLSLISRTA